MKLSETIPGTLFQFKGDRENLPLLRTNGGWISIMTGAELNLSEKRTVFYRGLFSYIEINEDSQVQRLLDRLF